MRFEKFLKLVSKIENIPLPAETSHLKMLPPFRDALIKKQEKVLSKAKQAGVLVLFYPDKNQVTKLKIIRKISQVYIPPSHFYVQPYIGVTQETPKFIKQDDEVEKLIEVDLEHFLDDKSLVLENIKASYVTEVEVPAFKLNDYIVWGATAMMLSEVKDLLKQL